MHVRSWRWTRIATVCPVLLAASLAACGGGSGTQTGNTEAFPGMPAPAFSTLDDSGATRSLADFKGKFVVLEWHNNACPANTKQYDSHNMQTLQKWWTDKGVIWLIVESSAPGADGYVAAKDAHAWVLLKSASPTAVLLDPQGTIGRAYGAKTTPQVIIIDPKGLVIYNGAIDDKPGTDVADIPKAKNYVSQALNQAVAGLGVKEPTSTAYGCSVKYANAKASASGAGKS